MFFKLAIHNVRRSLRDYAIYFLTLTFGVCLFYVFNSMDSQQAMTSLNSNQREIIQLLTSAIGYVSIFISFILGFLVAQSLHAAQTGGSRLHSHSQRPVDNCDTRQKERCRERAPYPSHEIRQDECGRLSRSP